MSVEQWAWVILGVTLVSVIGAIVWSYRLPLMHLSFESIRWLLGLRNRYLNIKSVSWHIAESRHWQKDRPTMILIHGFGCNMEMWIDFVLRMPRKCNLLLVDMPGHGRTQHYQAPEQADYSLEAQADRLHELLQHLGLSKVILCGSSMGGGISLRYAERYPDHVSKLVLFNSAGFRRHRAPLDDALDRGENPLILQNRQQIYASLRFITQKSILLPWPFKAAWGDEMAKRAGLNTKIFGDILSDVHALSKNAEAIFQKIPHPTLVIWGHYDRVLSVKDAHEFHRLLPNATLKVFGDLGHLPMMEAPRRTGKAVMGFVLHAH